MKPPTSDPREFAHRGHSADPGRMLAAGTFWSLIARFGHTLVMLAGTVVLARLLTPQDFGLVAITTALAILMLVMSEGLIDYPAVRANDLTADRVTSLIVINLGLVAAISIIVWGMSDSIERLFAIPHLSAAFKASIAIFVTQVFLVAGRAMLRRRHEFGLIARITFLSAVSYVVTAVAMALEGWGFWSLIVGQLASTLTMAFAFGWKSRLPLRLPRSFGAGDSLKTGVWGLVSRAFAWFWTSIDTIAIGLMLNAAATGLYSRAYNFAVQMKEPFAAIDHPLRQGLVIIRERDGTIRRASIRILRMLGLATSFAACFCVVLRDEIVWLLLGERWAAAAVPLAILILALPARIALNFLDSALIVAGSMVNLVNRQIMLSVVIGVLVWPASGYGIVGVAALVTASLYLALGIPVRAETGELPTRAEIGLALAPGLLTGGALVALSELVLRPLTNGSLTYVLAVTFVSSVAALGWVLLYPTHELIDVAARLRERHLYSRLRILKRLFQ